MVPGASCRLLPHLHWRTGLSYTLSLLDQPCCSLDLLHLSLTSFPEHDVSWLSPNARKPPSRDTINSAAVCPVLCNQQYPNRSSSVILHSKAKLTSVLTDSRFKGTSLHLTQGIYEIADHAVKQLSADFIPSESNMLKCISPKLEERTNTLLVSMKITYNNIWHRIQEKMYIQKSIMLTWTQHETWGSTT